MRTLWTALALMLMASSVIAATITNDDRFAWDNNPTDFTDDAWVDYLTDSPETLSLYPAASTEHTYSLVVSEETGSVLYFDGTEWQGLAVGASGEVLAVANTIPGWITHGGSAGLLPVGTTDNATLRWDDSEAEWQESTDVLIAEGEAFISLGGGDHTILANEVGISESSGQIQIVGRDQMFVMGNTNSEGSPSFLWSIYDFDHFSQASYDNRDFFDLAADHYPIWVVRGDNQTGYIFGDLVASFATSTTASDEDIEIGFGSSTAREYLRWDYAERDFEITDDLLPESDNSLDLGQSGREWAEAWVQVIDDSDDYVEIPAAIISVGTYDGSATLPVSGTGTRFMWIPELAAIRAGYATTQWDVANIGDYSVAFGEFNRASGSNSVVVGGESNISADTHAAVLGGYNVIANGSYTVSVGGSSNNNQGNFSVIVGGYNNYISDPYCVVVGGQTNSATGSVGGQQGSAVVGGYNNTASGPGSFVGAGTSNTAAGQFSTIPGGHTNTIDGSGQYSAIVGGEVNQIGASGNWGSVLGGDHVVVNGDHSMAQGENITVTGDRSFVISHNSSLVTMAQDDTIVFYNPENTGYSVGINELAPLSGSAGLEINGAFRVDSGTNGSAGIGPDAGEGYVERDFEVDGDTYFGDSSADTTTVTGDLNQVETETMNIVALAFTPSADRVASGAITTIDLSAYTYSGGFAYCWYYALDVEPGTVITGLAVEGRSVGTSAGTLQAKLIRVSDAESQGNNTHTALLSTTWDPAGLSTAGEYYTGSGSVTVADDYYYYITVLADGNDSGMTYTEFWGCVLTMTTENF